MLMTDISNWIISKLFVSLSWLVNSISKIFIQLLFFRLCQKFRFWILTNLIASFQKQITEEIHSNNK